MRDATFKANTSQPRPISATAVVMDTTHAKAENEEDQHVSAAIRSLWDRAINSDGLSPQEYKTLTDAGLGVASREAAFAVDAVRSIMDGILNKKNGALWKIKFRGEEVVLRDVGMKILRWVDKFNEIGDTIVQYDPGHAALPWVMFRFLLQAYLKLKNLDAILVGLEKTACLIDRCTIYELLYINENSTASKNLEKSILRLYTAILKFLAKAVREPDGECFRVRLYCC